MSTPTVAPNPALNRDDFDGDALDHVYCCDPDVALCGADLADADEDDEEDADELWCVVCEELDDMYVPCSATCGYAVSP